MSRISIAVVCVLTGLLIHEKKSRGDTGHGEKYQDQTKPHGRQVSLFMSL